MLFLKAETHCNPAVSTNLIFLVLAQTQFTQQVYGPSPKCDAKLCDYFLADLEEGSSESKFVITSAVFQFQSLATKKKVHLIWLKKGIRFHCVYKLGFRAMKSALPPAGLQTHSFHKYMQTI